MQAVNLLPRELDRTTRRPNVVAIVAAAGALFLAAVLGGLFVLSSSTLSENEAKLALARAELAALPAPAQPEPAQDAALAAERAPRVAALSTVLAQRVSWDRVLRRFSLVLPEDVWLQNLTLTNAPVAATPAPAGQPATAPAVPTGFSITGRTYSHAGVARLLSRLTAVPDLQDVRLSGSKRVEVGGQMVVEFTIVAGVRADGASA